MGGRQAFLESAVNLLLRERWLSMPGQEVATAEVVNKKIK
jgi:hypothetical protein